ncbi:MAG: flagella basal body P-ring formation protein FlgA [Planctomycetes bacterium]|nr:flagella basal body P-ring formation protein FlgA [Planctomycetota bacterium]NOG53520.1 flagellar basal body P-ring formation protein FlgA [Planctomycetota bacterium]
MTRPTRNTLYRTLSTLLLITATLAWAIPTQATGADEKPTQAAPSSGTIRLRPASTYDPGTDVITLADVADLTGTYATSLSGLIIRSDVHLTSPTITLSDIRAALKSPTYIKEKQGPNTVNHALLALSGGRCTIKAAASESPSENVTNQKQAEQDRKDTRPGTDSPDRPACWLSDFNTQPGTIGATVTDTLAARLEADMNPRDVQFICDADDYNFLTQPVAGRGLEVIPLAAPMSPRVPVEINLYEGRSITESRRMTVDVAVLIDVLVLQDYIARNSELQPADVAVETKLVPPSTIPVYPVDLPYIGRQARSRLSEGQILHVNDLVDPVLVQARSQVIVRAHAGNWIVRMPALALESGRPGQLIRIRRLTDRTELMARIEPDGELVIPSSFGGLNP